MGFLDKVRAPRSKRDRSLPYTYEALVDILSGQGRQPIWDHYFSDTICGLIDSLRDGGIAPADVRLFGVYRRRRSPLELGCCLDADGEWLERPELCRALEAQYRRTMDARYRGHVERGHCAFEDRDRRADGPVW
jgi:hypothetical protein